MARVAADPDTRLRVATLGYPPEDIEEAASAARSHPAGFHAITPAVKGKLHGNAIFQASFAAEKWGKESTERGIALQQEFILEGTDLPHLAEAIKLVGYEWTRAGVELGYRKRDVVFAAKAARLWPYPEEGRKQLKAMKEFLEQKLKVEVLDEEIRYCALVWRNLDANHLEYALRDRHPSNSREVWLRGASIPLTAWAYKLSSPHAGAAIDEAKERRVRRERIGHEVLAILGRRHGRTIQMPGWL